MGRVQIEELPVYKTLYYSGIYTKDIGNDDEYRPEDFGFTLGVTTNEAEDDIVDIHITWGVPPYDNDEERHTVEGRIINNYYTYIINHDAQIN